MKTYLSKFNLIEFHIPTVATASFLEVYITAIKFAKFKNLCQVKKSFFASIDSQEGCKTTKSSHGC